MAKAYSLGVAAAMPQAAQILDSFHVVAALHKGDRPCEVRGEVRVGKEAQGCLPRRTYAWLKRWESLTECQLAKREELDPAKTHLRGDACLSDGKAMQDVYGCPDKKSTAKAPDHLCSWMMHSVVAKIKRMAGTFRQERKGILNWWRRDPPIRFSKGSTPPPS